MLEVTAFLPDGSKWVYQYSEGTVPRIQEVLYWAYQQLLMSLGQEPEQPDVLRELLLQSRVVQHGIDIPLEVELRDPALPLRCTRRMYGAGRGQTNKASYPRAGSRSWIPVRRELPITPTPPRDSSSTDAPFESPPEERTAMRDAPDQGSREGSSAAASSSNPRGSPDITREEHPEQPEHFLEVHLPMGTRYRYVVAQNITVAAQDPVEWAYAQYLADQGVCGSFQEQSEVIQCLLAQTRIVQDGEELGLGAMLTSTRPSAAPPGCGGREGVAEEKANQTSSAVERGGPPPPRAQLLRPSATKKCKTDSSG